MRGAANPRSVQRRKSVWLRLARIRPLPLLPEPFIRKDAAVQRQVPVASIDSKLEADKTLILSLGVSALHIYEIDILRGPSLPVRNVVESSASSVSIARPLA